MAEKLTPQQQMAVENRGGNLLVSAAAGSGKTKVLVDRLLGYLTDEKNPANLDEFLIITYTKAAASELRGKIASKLAEAIAAQPENRHLQHQMQRLFLTKISTVHGFCGDLLREYAYRLDLSADFRVADENECREIRERVLSDLLDRAYENAANNPDFRAFADTQGLGRTDRLAAEIILQVYDSARCHLNPQGWLDSCLDACDVEGLIDAADTPWGRFLMEELFSYLDCQIAVMRECAAAAESADRMEKVAILLNNISHQLEFLRESATWDEIIERKDIDFGRLSFPRKDCDEILKERIKACQGACKDGLRKKLRIFSDDSRQILEDLDRSAAGARGLMGLVRQFEADYTRAKESRRVLDFSDLEHRTLDLLLGRQRTAPTAAAREIGSRFREILVDEYQDSNGVQDAIFSALTASNHNCFMVGDVKQSIYQFRLADPGIFLEKYHKYVPADQAEPGEGRKVLLSANFRSGGEVVSAVNDVFSACMSPRVGGLDYGPEEALREGIPHEKLPDTAVELHCVEIREDTYREEAAYTARRIKQMLDAGTLIRDKEGLRPVRPEDIVILLRSPGSVGSYYQRALENLGIRCASGGGGDLLQTSEIATLWALLQVIGNPRQDIPLIAALASPVFGFTADDLAVIRSVNTKCSFYEALCFSGHPKAVDFLDKLQQLRQQARMHPVTELIESIFSLTRLDSIYAAMEGGDTRRSNLQTFYGLAADFENSGRRELNQFLDYLQLQQEKGLILPADTTNAGCVTMMSIHKSKGLEFPVVFLCGLSRQFNREDLRAQVLCDKELGLGLSVADTARRVRYPAVSKSAIAAKKAAESLSEEMRVLYVALTRARDRLVMTYAARNLQKDLSDIVNRSGFGGRELLTRDVVCPGEWVLLAALERTEAGRLFQLAGHPGETKIGDFPWLIQVGQAPADEDTAAAEEVTVRQLPADTGEILQKALAFRYQHMAATQAPSKQTATQRKGRVKDAEAAENAPVREIQRSWRRPSFLKDAPRGKEFGNAMHGVLQYIRYENCGTLEGVTEELHRLVREKSITPEQASMVSSEKLHCFFASTLGRKLVGGANHLREFKFSILDDGKNYNPALEGEQVLLQGVVDCVLLEADGITVVDFKTDYVTEENLKQLTQRYEPQVRTYADALSRIYRQNVKAAYLYFFHLDRFVAV